MNSVSLQQENQPLNRYLCLNNTSSIIQKSEEHFMCSTMDKIRAKYKAFEVQEDRWH